MFMSDDDRPRAIPYRLKRRQEERVTILGSQVDLVRPEEMLLFVARRLREGRTTIIANHNLNSLSLVRHDAEMQGFYEKADLIELDSIPMIFWGQLTGHPARRFHRCTYLDWRNTFWPMAVQEKWRVFYLGAEPGVAEAGAAAIRAEYPEVEIATRHGYFDMTPATDEAQAVVEAIKAFAPQIVLVGMGMPRQEIWIARYADQLGACALFSVGAAFDYEAGHQKAPPRWLGNYGLEWLYRLANDPKRLTRRYLVEPWAVAPAALADLRNAVSGRRVTPS